MMLRKSLAMASWSGVSPYESWFFKKRENFAYLLYTQKEMACDFAVKNAFS